MASDLLTRNLNQADYSVDDPAKKKASGNSHLLAGQVGGPPTPMYPTPGSPTGYTVPTGGVPAGSGVGGASAGAAPADNPTSPTNAFQGYNPSYEQNVTVTNPDKTFAGGNSREYATPTTAQQVSDMTGGVGVQDENLGGGFQNSAPMRDVKYANGRTLNAGSMAGQFAQYGTQPTSPAWNMIARDIAGPNSPTGMALEQPMVGGPSAEQMAEMKRLGYLGKNPGEVADYNQNINNYQPAGIRN